MKTSSKAILDDLRGVDFIPIQVLAGALWDGGNQLDVALALKGIICEGEPPLLMLGNLDDAVAASAEARLWTIHFLEKCARKPRLFSARRVNARVGWTADEVIAHRYIRAVIDSVGLSEVFAAEGAIGWYDGTMAAEKWFDLKSLPPREAAMLLCRQNPMDKSSDPLNVSTDETTPDDFNWLMRVFEDVATDGKSRRLMQWLSEAKIKGLKYHSWIDEYISAVEATSGAQETAQFPPSTVDDSSGQTLPAEDVTSGKAEGGESPARPLGRQQFQENEILRVICELGYDAKALPTAKKGTKGVKAEVRKAVPMNSTGIFDGAWERLRANGEIQDAA